LADFRAQLGSQPVAQTVQGLLALPLVLGALTGR
jgi:hypothetical protein